MAGRQIRRFKYAASAIDRIRQKNAENVVEFFDEVSQQAITRAVSILPNLPGFRPNSEQGVHQQIQLLAKRLVGRKAHRPQDTQRDFDVLGFVWTMWGTEHLGAASIIDGYIDRTQAQVRDEIGDGDEKANDHDLLALELFEGLRDLSRTNRCGRADIKRFFDFSPFCETERLRNIIDSCKPVAEVARDKNLSALPHKVERAEQEIADLFKTVEAFSSHDKARAEELSALRKDVETLQKMTSEGSETALGMRKRLEEALSEIASQKQQAAEEITAQGNFVQAATTSMKKLQSDLAAILDQVNPLSERSAKADEAIISINAELDQLHELMTEIRTIVNRVSATERPIDTESNGAASEVRPARVVALEMLRGGDRSGEPAALRQVDEFVSALAANLEALSIKKSSAEALALECVAAFMAGQMPYFAGLNGKRVADACAMALAATGTYVLTVPVGISAPTEFRRQLGYLSANERQDVGCVIIEGINRSALDAFGECLIEMVSRQRSGDRTSRSLLMMATLTDGPASLPLSVAHVSLGPVFHTDALDWRSRPQTNAQRVAGGVSKQVWEEVCSAAERATPDSEEALRLLDEFVPIANPLLRGTILSGFRALSALRNDRAGPTALQSLAFGWLAPLCIAVGATAEAVDQEFDQGIVDGTVPDTRFANLLRSGILDNTQGGGV